MKQIRCHQHLSFCLILMMSGSRFLISLATGRATTLKLRWLEHRQLVYHHCSNSFLSSLEKKPMAADFGKFRMIFFIILKMVYCMYSLELLQ